MNNRPRSLDQLIPYLTANPRVHIKQYVEDKLIADEDRNFLRYEQFGANGRFIWEDSTGEIAFTPVNCFANGLEVFVRFTRTKFVFLIYTLNSENIGRLNFYYKD